MHWTLSRTACICAWRPLRVALHANPLLAAIVLASLPGLPLLALSAGRAAEPAMRAAASEPALARGLAFAAVVGAVATGVAIASLAPTRALLGEQLQPAPLGPAETFVGLTLLPAAVALAPLAVLVAAFVFTATASAGGPWVGTALVAGVAAACALGAAAAEGSQGALRRSGRAFGVVVLVAGVWLAIGTAGGFALFGPAALMARAMSEPTPVLVAAVAATGIAGLALWGVATSSRPRDVARHSSVRLALPATRSPALAVGGCTVARLVRNAHVRRHVAAGLAFAGVGALALRALTGSRAAPYFAGFVAVLVAAAIPLIAAGLRRDGGQLLRVVPVSHRHIRFAGAAASVLVGFAVLALTLLVTAPLGRLSVGALLMLEATAALVLGAAAASGAVLPWRSDRVLEQLASYGLLAVVAGTLTFALGRAAGAAPALGLSEATFAALAAHCVLLGGIAASSVLEE